MDMKAYQRRTWLITYGASSISITHTICSQFDMDIDECYTLTQRDLKYTLIHLTKKQALKSIQTLLKKAESSYGIVQSHIFGYESIAGNDSNLKDHPGMQLMIDHMNKKDVNFEHWMLKGDLYSNPKGIMHRFLINGDRSKMTKFQLEFLLQQKEKRFQEKEKRIREQLIECEQCNEELGAQNDEFKAEIRELETENK